MFIDIQKVRENAKLPERAHESDAGADVFYSSEAPNKDKIVIHSGDSRLLGTGIKIAVPYGYVAEIKNKSGIAARRNLIVGACVVDSGFSGEVFVNLHNIGQSSQEINAGDKVAQIVVYPVMLPKFNELSKDVELYHRTETDSNRGTGSLGSTGK